MNGLKKHQRRICLFFTNPISLKTWAEFGIIDRETILYKNLCDKNIKVSFFTYGNEQDYKYSEAIFPITIRPAYENSVFPKTLPGRIISSLIIPIRFYSFFKEQDILKTNQMRGAWVPLIVKWLTGKKLLVRCGFEQYQLLMAKKASYLKRWFYYFLSKAVYKNGDAIIVTSSLIADFISNTFAIDRGKISVYSNLIDTDLFRFSEINKKSQGLLFVGRLNPEKNLFNLITAVKIVNIPLTIVGEGELLSNLQEHTTQIRADVTFLGLVPNSKLPELILQHNIFILSSFYEGNPKALLEAMSCGRAVIGTDVPGIRNIISHQINGMLCGTEADQIADAIEFLRNDIKLQQTLGKNAHQYVENNCNVEKIVSEEIAVIRRLLNE